MSEEKYFDISVSLFTNNIRTIINNHVSPTVSMCFNWEQLVLSIVESSINGSYVPTEMFDEFSLPTEQRARIDVIIQRNLVRIHSALRYNDHHMYTIYHHDPTKIVIADLGDSRIVKIEALEEEVRFLKAKVKEYENAIY